MYRILKIMTLASIIYIFSVSFVFAQNVPQVSCSVCDARETDSGIYNPQICAVNTELYDYCHSGLLPLCAKTKKGCTQIGDIALTAINYGRFIFGISGAVALLFVIYGGGMMLFSFGNAERMEKGRGALVAAVIGLIIIFTAYLAIAFIVKSLGLPESEIAKEIPI